MVFTKTNKQTHSNEPNRLSKQNDDTNYKCKELRNINIRMKRASTNLGQNANTLENMNERVQNTEYDAGEDNILGIMHAYNMVTNG